MHSIKGRPLSIVNKSDIGSPQSHKPRRDIATIPPQIFAENKRPPTIEFKPPEPDKRLNDTPQLACSLGLLQSSDDILDSTTRNWVQVTRNNPDEQERLKVLVKDVVRTFKSDELNDAKAISEITYLTPVLEKDDFRYLLNEFYTGIDQSGVLEAHQLEGLAQLLQGATDPNYLDADDLTKILGLISKRPRNNNGQSQLQLTLAVSHVLDAMADTKVKGLDREKLHEPMRSYLDGLKGSTDPYLVYQAAYAYQALQYIPENETLWQTTLKRSGKIQGVSELVSAAKGMDLDGFIEGLGNIQQGSAGTIELVQLSKTAYDGSTLLTESGQGFLASLKEGLGFESKRAWYPALRGADSLVRDGRLAEFKKLVCEAPCRRDPAFQWGVCQRLGDLASDPKRDADIRQSAVAFLGEIYRSDVIWGQQVTVKQWILSILMRLSPQTEGETQCTWRTETIDATQHANECFG